MPVPAEILWHPHTNMASFVPEDNPVCCRAQGTYIWDEQGRQYFDGTSALWFANIGHGNESVARAMYEQACRLETFHTFVGNSHRPVLDLMERLYRLAPLDDPRIILGSGGSDAADIALKLARRYWQVLGKPKKQYVLAREHAYHGLHAFGTSVVGDDDLRKGYGSLVPYVCRISDDNLQEVRETIEDLGAESIAAIIAEPIIGAGGMIPASAGYLAGLRALADEFDILLIFDEVVSGFGRTGEWFASELYGVTPDMTMFAKGVTSGYAPLGGVFVAARVWEPFYDSANPQAPAYWHGLTYSGHAVSCAAAMANLEFIEDNHLLGHVRELSQFVDAELHRVFERNEYVADVRSKGLLGGVELHSSVSAGSVVAVLRDEFGQLVRPCNQTVTISPPFISTIEELRSLIADIAEAVDLVAGRC
ncbi:aminotransferase [Bifidobacterium aquikefiri]|uniref:Aminotransferase n=2 Tax=Bifidobacterium aquikefiri TaxID=1653207 RepID=A0A261G787_9BIFI|nr:aminotransferase [Bifidobacterium aquikefiri]